MAPSNTSRKKLLDAALYVIRSRGYEATTVEALCAEAGVSKGAFFHNFASKEELAIAAAAHFKAMADALFTAAPYTRLEDPRERLLGYLALRRGMLQGELSDYTCLLGTMVQETYESHPRIRDACRAALDDHIAMLSRDVAAAKARYAPKATWTPQSVASSMQAMLQGAFILAKAHADARIAGECVDHLSRYVAHILPLEHERI